jgi:hypothetical protein
MTDISTAISNLKSRWLDLADLDRARAVYEIHQAATSVRTLAKTLGFSESLLRHLLTALQAPAEDRYLAQQGKITTNELVRRAKAAGVRRGARHREALALQHIEDAREASRKICQWLVEERIPGSYGEQIVTEARRQLAVAELTRKLPKGAAPPDLPVAGIIRKCRPAGPKPDNAELVSWIARWLALWAAYAFTDPDVRLQALDLALEIQGKR